MEKKNYRMTKQRKIIYEFLMKYPTHPTAEELYEKVRKVAPDISLGTIYRNLEVLCEQGYAVKVPAMDKKMHFDANTSEHFHIQCESCGKLMDFMGEVVDIDKNKIENDTGYVCNGFQLRFYGLCPECLNKKTGKE